MAWIVAGLVYVRNWKLGALVTLFCMCFVVSFPSICHCETDTCNIFDLTVTGLKRRKLRPKRIQAVNKNYICSLYFSSALVFILWSVARPQLLYKFQPLFLRCHSFKVILLGQVPSARPCQSHKTISPRSLSSNCQTGSMWVNRWAQAEFWVWPS